jgi:hypothetical protein
LKTTSNSPPFPAPPKGTREKPAEPVVSVTPAPETIYEDEVEMLVADARGDLTPGQIVEQKLMSLLRGQAVPLSHLRLTPRPGRWNRK